VRKGPRRRNERTQTDVPFARRAMDRPFATRVSALSDASGFGIGLENSI